MHAMTVDSWLHLIAGFFITASVAAAVYVDPRFLWFTAFVGANLLQSGLKTLVLRVRQQKTVDELEPRLPEFVEVLLQLGQVPLVPEMDPRHEPAGDQRHDNRHPGPKAGPVNRRSGAVGRRWEGHGSPILSCHPPDGKSPLRARQCPCDSQGTGSRGLSTGKAMADAASTAAWPCS